MANDNILSEDPDKVFKLLNQKLKENNETLEMICGGGFVLSHYGIRTTTDIDAFYNSNYNIQKAIFDTGSQLNINKEDELWLNNSIQNLNRTPPDDICETKYEYSNLKIKFPPADYMILMKLSSGRQIDISDCAELIKRQKIADPENIMLSSKKYNFREPDESLVFEAFGEAYGLDWLAEYFQDKESAIFKILDPKFDKEQTERDNLIKDIQTDEPEPEPNKDYIP